MKDTGSTDYLAITARQKETWATGDFNEIARQNSCMAEALCEAIDLHPGERVLDVGCGSGTAALVAARRYCKVTGIDFVDALVERAKTRAAADGLEADFCVADAQALPFPDASFDVVLSVYGVQFAPGQGKAASELQRVCRPGGRIGLATPFRRDGEVTFLQPTPNTRRRRPVSDHPSSGAPKLVSTSFSRPAAAR